MGLTIDERLLQKKYDLWVSKLENQQQAAKPKAAHDAAEARKKKTHAAALSAFKAAQARQGVPPPPTARSAPDHQSASAGASTNSSPGRSPLARAEPAGKPKVRSLADELEDDGSPSPKKMPASTKTASKPAPEETRKSVADRGAPPKGTDGKPSRAGPETKRGMPEKRRDADPPTHKRNEPDSKAPQDMAPPHKRRYNDEAAQRERAVQGSDSHKSGPADASHQERDNGGARGGPRAPPPRHRPQQRSQRAMLFVGDLPFGTSDEDLARAFSGFGALASTRVVPNKCFGFVEFRDEGVAQSLLSQQQHDVRIQGREVRIAPSSGPLPEWKKGPTVLVQNGGDGYGSMAYVTQGASLNDQVGGPQPRTTNVAPPQRRPVGAPELPDERRPIVYDDI